MLKEVYISPSVELVLLRADSQLASNTKNEIDFDKFFNVEGWVDGESGNGSSDIDVEIPSQG